VYPRRLEPQPLDDGPHLSYMLQWFAFAATALVFAGVIARPEKR
jgi:cytochrome oxidase assembly protein ShyY1